MAEFSSPPRLLTQLFLKAGRHTYSGATTWPLPWLHHLVASHQVSSARFGLVLEQETSRHLQSIEV